eukprot:m.50904 g.50904  ORF g.50904 m.50904 type:complete len:646 (-) comp6263_c0_seq4:81-2018(-)
MLPTHVGPDGRPVALRSRGPSCTSENKLLMVVFLAFCVILFGSFFFLPDFSDGGRGGHGHGDGHRGIFTEKPDTEIEPQPTANPGGPAFPDGPDGPGGVEEEDDKIEKPDDTEEGDDQDAKKVSPENEEEEEEEETTTTTTTTTTKKPTTTPPPAHVGNKPQEQIITVGNDRFPAVIGPAPSQSYKDAQSEERRLFVRKMMKTAWDGYAQHAWGQNELMPISQRGHAASIFGGTTMGATIVDALDTLYIMELNDEFKAGRDWVASSLNFDVSTGVSVFEVTIRFLGGLLTAFAMTGDEVFKTKALDLGRRLLPAFNTGTGIPHAIVNLANGQSHNWGWASGGCSILSELGTMQLEFEMLARVTGEATFAEKVRKVMNLVVSMPKPSNGMYANYINADNGQWCANDVSVGALGDSFYEYLLKYWLYTGSKEQSGRVPFDDAMKTIREKLTFKSDPSHLQYIAEAHGMGIQHKMGHLACFIAGLFGIGSKNAPNDLPQAYMELAAGITNTCHEGYHRSPTGLGPESMYFEGGQEARSDNPGERYYILRPEVVESYFYLWRLTHEQKYRDWAWEAVQAIEKHCRCGVGYCGIRDVQSNPAQQDDVQQSFFLAETMKYLYLIFTEDNVIPLDKWVFNTEAHPLPIVGAA